MKKKLAATLLAGALSTVMIVPAFATVTTHETGTEVWAGVIVEDKNPVVKVEVPTLFAFVVNGTITDTDESAVTTSNNNIYLPNYKVVGDSLTITSDKEMKMNNYSTYQEGDIRKGLKLNLKGEIKETLNELPEKDKWVYSNTIVKADEKGNRDDFRKYRILIDGNDFKEVTPDGYKMAEAIDLEAPDTQNGNLDESSQLAIRPTTHYANFDVIVGGQRGQYKEVEQSAKIGTIVWTVSPDIQKADENQ